ncbi:hypothetical protein [Spiroplasma floricola]|uniref:Uncharacterized protein n=1 Tax=Spiroplasma floricola 23-6 TaxID=1336749 RepID=A0A2K8SE39_9MOLU|nr:hypothetical protein [Spiroplasma floricola]AUB31721.1 hypothetical protein SFLOR_v1c06730 [Spiroplasma floricola 23-6]
MEKKWLDGSILRRTIFIYTIIALFCSVAFIIWLNLISKLFIQNSNDKSFLVKLKGFGGIIDVILTIAIFVSYAYIIFAIQNAWVKIDKGIITKYLVLGIFDVFSIIFIPTYILSIVYYIKATRKLNINYSDPNFKTESIKTLKIVCFWQFFFNFFLEIYFWITLIWAILDKDETFKSSLITTIILISLLYTTCIIYIFSLLADKEIKFSKKEQIILLSFLAIPCLNYLTFLIIFNTSKTRKNGIKNEENIVLE